MIAAIDANSADNKAKINQLIVHHLFFNTYLLFFYIKSDKPDCALLFELLTLFLRYESTRSSEKS